MNKNSNNSYLDFHIDPSTLFTALILSIVSLSFCGIASASAATSTANASINVASACTLTTTGTGTYSTTMNPGATKELTGSPLKVSCNDKNGYDLYAIGFSGDSYDTNNTDMLSSLGTSYNIKTNTSGSNSYWAMKVAGSGTNTPTIDNSYSNYKTIPTTYTKISHFTGTTTNSITTPTYKVTLSSDQAAGTYTGKVKYTIVHPSGTDAPNHHTIADSEYMQDVGSCPEELATEVVYTLKDARDEQSYKVAKLKDGKCWMVENLNLAGGTALSVEDTDVTSEYISTFSTSNNLIKDGNTIVLPASSSVGFNTSNYSYVFNLDDRVCSDNANYAKPCYGYYSWDAATLGSGRDISSSTFDAPHSICPKHWRLPTSGDSSNWKQSDIYSLATAYGADLEDDPDDASADTGANFYNNAGPGTIPSFWLAGGFDNGSFNSGGFGNYWTSTGYGDYFAHRVYFSHNDLYSNRSTGRYVGYSVRCLLKNTD